MVDCHTHTEYSPDGCEKPEEMVRAAISKGISYLAFTDHFEIGQNGNPTIPPKQLAVYRETIESLKEKYRGSIEIASGIEAGYTKHTAQKIAELTEGFHFDFIINSVHEADGEDCFFARYFAGKSKQKSYGEYFEAVLDSLDAPYPYHTVGHMSYVERKSPYPDPIAHYGEFKDLIDAILQKIIAKKKILEINTNTYGAALPWIPNTQILERYRALGGTRITFSSDAHRINRLGDKYAETAEFAKKLGFSGFTVISGGKEKTITF